jgi:hypothetical protein
MAKTPQKTVSKSAEKAGNDKKQYLVTELAGPRIAGKRAKKGEKIALTAAEARCELAMGTIKDPDIKSVPAASSGGGE